MSTDILKLYKISFQEVQILGKDVKIMFSPYSILNQLAYDTSSESDVNDTLDCINSVLDGGESSIVFSTVSMVTVEILPKFTKFYDDVEFDSTTPVLFSISTIHLKKIILLWKDYVL